PAERGRGVFADACTVPISEIITVEETDVNGKQYSSGKWQKMEKPYAFTVHRVRRARRHRWRWAQVTFWCPEEQLYHLWLQTLRELLETLTSRPKHLLVFINPLGGRGQGKRIYEKKVAPLFTLASITTEIIVTERANHAKESLYELNIDKYDGFYTRSFSSLKQKSPGAGVAFRCRAVSLASCSPARVLGLPGGADCRPSLGLGSKTSSRSCEPASSASGTAVPLPGTGLVRGRGLVDEQRARKVGPKKALRSPVGDCGPGDVRRALLSTHRMWDHGCMREGVLPSSPGTRFPPGGGGGSLLVLGSTDCVCYSTVGTNDAETSALHIIVGDSLSMDVSAVHHDSTLLRYSVSLLGYGFYGDIIKDSERKRWMGLIRYDFSGLKTFFSHHCYEGTVSFLPAQHTVGSPRDRKPCRAGCPVCRQSRQQLEEEQKRSLYGLDGTGKVSGPGAPPPSLRSTRSSVPPGRAPWPLPELGEGPLSPRPSELLHACLQNALGLGVQVLCGQFLAINATNMSCACPRSPQGLSPAAHLGDGSSDLILIRKCSRFNFLRFLVRHTNQGDQFDFTFVEVYRVKKFQFVSKPAEEEDSSVLGRGKKRLGPLCSEHPASCCCRPSSSSWNCDGEVLSSPAIEVRVHCQLVRLFARGIEESPKQESRG
ncbi:PREDICTED: ceramide kinase, partial [Bison bison bison]|uniref:Ceramide kinase n=1 Tax=Bison bison bison TaxID=43346 RepID=A0A6P3ILX9_BISBB